MKKIFLLLAWFAAFGALAQDSYRIVVPYAPGGGTDISARKLAQYIGRDLAAPVVVENLTGGNTSIGTSAVIKSLPNGRTMLISSVGALEGSTAEMNPRAYDWQQELRPVAIVTALSPWVLIVNKKYRTFADFVQALKTQPVNFGSPTANGNHVILARMLLRELQIDNANVAIAVYKSSPAILNDVVSGQIDATFATAYLVWPLINSNKVTALGVVTNKRLSYLNSTPTFSELGIKKLHVGNDYYGIWVPSKTPDETVNNLRRIIYNYVRVDGELYQEFVAMNFIDPNFVIPLDPTVEQARSIKLLQQLQNDFAKN